MLTAAERDASLETIAAFISAVHAHLESRARGGEPQEETDGPDPRVNDFLQQAFGPSFDKLPRAAYATTTGSRGAASTPRTSSQFDMSQKQFTFTAEDIAKDLPAEIKKMFLEMPAEERNFLLNLETHYRQPYSGMTLEDQAFFRTAKTAEKNAFIAMSNEERAFFRKLDPANRPFYMVLSSGNRALLRHLPVEELEKSLAASREEIAANSSKPAIDAAREIATQVVGKQGTPELRQAAQRVVVNYLNEHPGDQRTAYLGALSSLLQANETFFDALLREVGAQLGKLQGEAAGADVPGYLMKARHWMQGLAQQLVHPRVTREELIENLARVVVTGARFTQTYLPQKSAAAGGNPLQLRRPIMG